MPVPKKNSFTGVSEENWGLKNQGGRKTMGYQSTWGKKPKGKPESHREGGKKILSQSKRKLGEIVQ